VPPSIRRTIPLYASAEFVSSCLCASTIEIVGNRDRTATLNAYRLDHSKAPDRLEIQAHSVLLADKFQTDASLVRGSACH